jgi:hypothetical protein
MVKYKGEIIQNIFITNLKDSTIPLQENVMINLLDN